MEQPTIIKQDKRQDLTVIVTTIQTEMGYFTNISIETGGVIIEEERKSDSLELAEIQHNLAVTEFLRNDIRIIPNEEERPMVSRENPYLHNNPSFTKMLPGTEF
ncbi:MAG: hypothetical protein IPP77_12095 [Bacteroidetes bacterium]|nr:hypothetical protein [Bacteroidota bacterium]